MKDFCETVYSLCPNILRHVSSDFTDPEADISSYLLAMLQAMLQSHSVSPFRQ